MALGAGTVSDPAGLERELERQAIGDPLAVNLDQPVRLTPHPGPAIAVPLAGVLHDDMRGLIHHHECVTLRAWVT